MEALNSLENLSPKEGSAKKKKRVGRGIGSGSGKTAAKGHKGQKARKGSGPALGFEGGQTPLYRRLPKYGFSNRRFAKQIQEVSLQNLSRLNEGEVTVESLFENGLIKNLKQPIKIIGKAKLDRKYQVTGISLSKGAKESVIAAGGAAQ